jgi:hypothetical protein
MDPTHRPKDDGRVKDLPGRLSHHPGCCISVSGHWLAALRVDRREAVGFD